MLQGEMPFGSWRESEVDIVAKIAKGQLNLPQTLGPEAVDLITKVLFVNICAFYLFVLPCFRNLCGDKYRYSIF